MIAPEQIHTVAVVGAGHVVPVLAQRIAEQGLDRLLVVDQQDARGVLEHLRDSQGTPS